MREKEGRQTTHELTDVSEHVESLESKPMAKNPMAQDIIKAIEESYDVTMEDAEALLQVIKENQMPIRFDSSFGADK